MKILGVLVTLFLGFQTAFPQFDITSQITLAEYEGLFAIALIGWAIWAIWILRNHFRQEVVKETSRPIGLTQPEPKRILIDLKNTKDDRVIRPKASSEWDRVVRDEGGERTEIIDAEGIPSERDSKPSSHANRGGISGRGKAGLSASESTEEERSVQHSESEET